MQAKPNIVQMTASHFQVLNTQNVNKNMPNMILIAYLNENLPDCNENLAKGKQEAFIQSYIVWYKTKDEKSVKISFYIHFM